MAKVLRTFAAVASALVVGACTVHQASTPSLSGPSELALSFGVTATPDTLTQDGASQSVIRVTAFDAQGKPLAGLAVRLDIAVNGTIQDYGRLSTKSIVTGSDGKATTVYTAPPAPPSGSQFTTQVVTIAATPVGNNFDTATVQTASIRLAPPGVILPPAAAPTAQFTFVPTAPTVNGTVTFDASASQPGEGASSITSYAWSFGDGASASGKTATHSFSAESDYSVTLTVTNDLGIAASTTKSVTVGNPAAPTATFTFSPTSPQVNQTVQFNGHASTAAQGHSIVGFAWFFGDGASAGGSTASDLYTISHVYTVAGTYNVMLEVLDDAGQKAFSTQSVTVTSPGAPTAAFTFSPSAPEVGTAVNFNGSGSTAAPNHSLAAYSWDFGDGTPAGSGVVPTPHSYASAGAFNVVLTVTDDTGQKAVATQSVTVTSPAAPTASFIFSPSAPQVGQAVNFDASASAPAPGHTIMSYSWSWGDGTSAGSGVTSSHSFGATGTYTVQLTVTDVGGQSATATKSVIVGAAPTAAFVFSPGSPAVNQTVQFNASGSAAAPGRSIASYSWNWGDGTGAGSGVTPTHPYTATGTYSVVLTVTDDQGTTGQVTHTVTVGNATLPTPNFVFSPTTPALGETVNFDASSSTAAPGHSIASYSWNFGDGVGVGPGAYMTTTHPYTSENTFTVTLTVTDDIGSSATVSKTVPVTASPTANFVISPTDPIANATSVNFDGTSSSAAAGHSITGYAWNYGDGSPTDHGAKPSHVFTLPGSYQITLTVTDDLGHTGQNTQKLTVAAPPAP